MKAILVQICGCVASAGFFVVALALPFALIYGISRLLS